MKKLLALTLTVLMLTASVLSVSAGETTVSDTETRVKYGVHIDSAMTVYEDLESGVYKVESIEGYEAEIGGAIKYQDEENFKIMIFGKGGSGYLTLTDKHNKVVAANITLTKVDAVKEELKTTVEDGVYVVGKTIAAGVYKAEIVETEGYGVGLITSANTLDLDLSNQINRVETVDVGEVIEFEVTEEDYVINLNNVKLTKVE